MSIRAYNDTRLAIDYAIVAGKGLLKVYVPNGDELGAQWSVDYGDTWHDNGATAELPAKSTDYVITFKYIEDYVQPPDMLQRIAPGDVIDIIADPYQVDTDWRISLCSGGEVLSKARMSMTVSTFSGTSIESAIVKDGATMYVSGGGTLRTVYLQDGGNLYGIPESSGTSEVYPVLSDTEVYVTNSTDRFERYSVARKLQGGEYYVQSNAELRTQDFIGAVQVSSRAYTGNTGGGARDVLSGGGLSYVNELKYRDYPSPSLPWASLPRPRWTVGIGVASGGSAGVDVWPGTELSVNSPDAIGASGYSIWSNTNFPFEIFITCGWPENLPAFRVQSTYVMTGASGGVVAAADASTLVLSSGCYTGDSSYYSTPPVGSCYVAALPGGHVTVCSGASGSLAESGGYVDGDLTSMTCSGGERRVDIDLFNSATLHYPASWPSCLLTHSAKLEIYSGHIDTLSVRQYASAVFMSSSPWNSNVVSTVYEDGGYVDIPYGYVSTWSGTPNVLCGATGTLHGSCGSGAVVSGGGHLIMYSFAQMSGGFISGGFDSTASVTMSGGTMYSCAVCGNADLDMSAGRIDSCSIEGGAEAYIAAGASATYLTISGYEATHWWQNYATATIEGDTESANIGYGGRVVVSGGTQRGMNISGTDARLAVVPDASAWFDVLVVGSGAVCSIGSGNSTPQIMVNGGSVETVSAGAMMVQSGGYATVLSANLVEADAGGATVVIQPYGHVGSVRIWSGGVISSASTCVIDEIDSHYGGTVVGY